MMVCVAKGTRLNLRISDEFRADIERLADYHGLTMSSYAHSLLVKQIRREKENVPELFNSKGLPFAGVASNKADKKRKTG